jgi:hypothetical protein
VAVGDHSRARVLYRLPEQRRFGAAGMPGLLALLLGALVLFLGGLAVGRATMTGGQTAALAPAATAAATDAGSVPAPSATTPGTAASEATEATEAAATSRVGPRRVEHGVGVGYAHSRQGAVAAAANYTRVLTSELILDKASRHKAIDTLAAPEARARLQRTLDQEVSLLRKSLGMTAADDGTQVLLRATPVGWRVEEYSGDAATVAVWMTSVGGSVSGARGPVPIREAWGTTTVKLRWVDGDWKQVEHTSSDGPVPIADVSPPTAAADLVGQANEFKEFTYAPGS